MDSCTKRQIERDVGQPWCGAADVIEFPTRAPKETLWGCRIALYSHDTLGLGHVRRNLLLAQALAEADLNLGILLIAGTRQAGEFDLPPGVDTLILPRLSKQPDGRYCSRSLHVNLSDLVVLRAKTLCAALEAFNPDVLIVDNVPRGAVHELDPTLEYLHARGKTRLVFGMREVLDEPTAVEREWRHAANEETLRRYYDATALADRKAAVEERFARLAGEAIRPSVQTYTTLTLVRRSVSEGD